MSEVWQLVLASIILVLIIIYVRKIKISKMMKARDFIIFDLKSKGAVSSNSAVELGYAHKNMFRIGLRDDRPKVVKQLIQFNIVGVTEDNRFFLNESEIPPQNNTV